MRQYIVDAFTDRVFSGNQAAVCVLDEWLPDSLMQDIARENNFSETAFTVKEKEREGKGEGEREKEGMSYRLRWFTPGGEIDFCGHATLGTAFVLFRYYCGDCGTITFHTQKGPLIVAQKDGAIEMDFPAYENHPVAVTGAMTDALGVEPVEAYLDRDLLLVMESEAVVRALRPDMEKLKQLDGLCLGVTARGDGKNYDSVSRVFAPKLGVPEDPVTGSTHCMIVPLWASKLGKDEIVAYQASSRPGTLYARLCGGRVRLAGKAALYAVSDILPEENKGERKVLLK